MKQTKIDTPLMVLGLLLLATLVAFFTGLFPYPFGFIILAFALAGRSLQLRGRR